jgi:hypothetical protein
MNLKIYPESYYNNNGLKFSNFAIAGRNILKKYSNFINKDKPIILELKSKLGLTTYISILEFSATDDTLYINDNAFDILCINIGDEVECNLFDPPDATKVIFKPLNKSFYEINDIKSILEHNIIKKYQFLVKNQKITINYLDTNINLEIVSLEPYDICRTTEIDLNVDFEPIDEQKNTFQNTNSIKDSVDSINDTLKKKEITTRVNSDNLNVLSSLSREELRKKRLDFYNNKFSKS